MPHHTVLCRLTLPRHTVLYCLTMTHQTVLSCLTPMLCSLTLPCNTVLCCFTLPRHTVLCCLTLPRHTVVLCLLTLPRHTVLVPQPVISHSAICHLTLPNLPQVAVLNTNLYYMGNKRGSGDPDPCGQLSWLAQLLQKARSVSSKVGLPFNGGRVVLQLLLGVTDTRWNVFYCDSNAAFGRKECFGDCKVWSNRRLDEPITKRDWCALTIRLLRGGSVTSTAGGSP